MGVCAGGHTNINPSTSLEMARFTGQLTAYGFVPSLTVTIDSVRPTFVIQGDSRLRGMKQDSTGTYLQHQKQINHVVNNAK